MSQQSWLLQFVFLDKSSDVVRHRRVIVFVVMGRFAVVAQIDGEYVAVKFLCQHSVYKRLSGQHQTLDRVRRPVGRSSDYTHLLMPRLFFLDPNSPCMTMMGESVTSRPSLEGVW